MGAKTYRNVNVYDATQERLKFVFDNFENIYVSFSGGKDSGMLLNLCVQYMKKHGITRKIGVFHQDFEAQYTETTNYVTRMLTSPEMLKYIDVYWCCMPMYCKTATSMFEQYWVPWDPAKKDIWVRDMPELPCVINVDNHKFDFYRPTILQEELYAEFSPWYHEHVCGGKGKTICLVGIRTQESLNRWRAITKDKAMYKKTPWTTKMGDDIYSGYPIYDWTVEDIWVANAKFGFDYNKLYDLFHFAGLSIHEMRVASPFNDWALSSLKLYRAIEPNIWGRMVGRVNGANFTSMYGGTTAMGWKNIKLPKGHTWKSYVEFLLKTLPEETRKSYEEKFAVSIKFWREKGGVLSAETIEELRSMNINIEVKGKTNYKTDKTQVAFPEYPDDLDVKEFQLVPSYKRMAICIMKNDHLCKYMGFSQTKAEQEKRRAALEKFRGL
jgi:predicted phosphoadenosine phosphosulfate sulfurtransferase